MSGFKDLAERDKRALRVLAVALALAILWQMGRSFTGLGGLATEAILESLEQRYTLAQQLAARQPAREREARQRARALARLETGLLKSASPALAQAELRTAMSDLLEQAGIELEGSSFAPPETSGMYGAVPLGVEFTCGMDQLVALLASLATAETILAPRDLELRADHPETGSVRVRLTVEGYLETSGRDGSDVGAMP